MNATPNRRHADRYPSEPRCTYAENTVKDNTRLCQRNGYVHISLTALGWSELIVEDDFALLQAPAGFGDTP